MPIEIEAPDGSVVEFPDGTDDATIERAMRQAYPTKGPDFGDVSARVDSTARIVDLPAVRAEVEPQDDAEVGGWGRLPYFLRPSEMRDGSAGEFFGGHARDAGRSVRSSLRGIGGLLDFFGEPIAQGIDKLTEPTPELSDLITGQQPQRTLPRQVRFREIGDALADAVGLSRPETAQQRVTDDIGQALSGTAASLGIGGLLNAGRNAATNPTVAQGVGDMLRAQPKLQTVSAVTGAGAAGLTREAGGGEGAQLLAGLIGGLSPAAVTSGSQAALRGGLRGGETNRQALEAAIDDFASVGATPSVGQGTGSWARQGAESLLTGAPTSGGVMRRFAERQADQIGQSLQERAEGLYRNASGERAGRAVEQGIRGEDGFVARTRQTADDLYRRLDDAIPADTRVEVGNTRQALADLNSIIEGAPSVSRFFQNARLQGIESGLTSDVTGVDAVLSRPGMRENADAYRKFLEDGAAAVADRNLKRKQLGINVGEEKVPTAAEIDADVAATLGNMVDNKLPYEALQKLRTLVGSEIEGSSLISDVPRSKWKAVYGALTRDMEGAATTPEAKRALDRANTYFKARVDRLDVLDSVIERNGGPEKVYQAVMSGTKDGGTTLRAVMQSLPKDGQRALTGAVIKRMGLANPGAQDAAGDAFSAATFLTNWNKVSPEARRALFDRHGPQFTKDMDKIARVAGSIKEGSEVFRNPSGTANRGAALTYGGSLAASILTGQTGIAATLAGTGIGANGLARAMTNPRLVKWLSRATEMPVGALPAQINVLNRIAKETGDEEVAEFAAALEQARQNEVGKAGEAADQQKQTQGQ
jgi:hypothetical protein